LFENTFICVSPALMRIKILRFLKISSPPI
jgi:hypothetical protein